MRIGRHVCQVVERFSLKNDQKVPNSDNSYMAHNFWIEMFFTRKVTELKSSVSKLLDAYIRTELQFRHNGWIKKFMLIISVKLEAFTTQINFFIEKSCFGPTFASCHMISMISNSNTSYFIYFHLNSRAKSLWRNDALTRWAFVLRASFIL